MTEEQDILENTHLKNLSLTFCADRHTILPAIDICLKTLDRLAGEDTSQLPLDDEFDKRYFSNFLSNMSLGRPCPNLVSDLVSGVIKKTIPYDVAFKQLVDYRKKINDPEEIVQIRLASRVLTELGIYRSKEI